MNNKITNPYLKQLLSEISNNANKNRLSDLSWEAIYEARKKKSVKKEQDEKKKDAPAEDPAAEQPAADQTGGDLPPLGGTDETPKDTGAPEQAPATGAKPADQASAAPKAGADTGADQTLGGEDTGEDDTEKAKADAAKAKAELEKAKAEKEQAEKEIEKNQYVTIGSSGGTQFLLSKVLDHAFKSNTIDALASEMVDKLKIQTPEDMDAFSEDVVTYMTIPGMSDLISSMKTLATKQPETPAEEPAA